MRTFDLKTPLLRSEEKLNQVVLRLLRLCEVKAERVFSLLEVKQQFFLVDRAFYQGRLDLLHTGRALFSARTFVAKERAVAYLRELEKRAAPLEILAREIVSPQWEVATPREKGLWAVEQNRRLGELMQEVALEHDLVCLFHEKPFDEMKGSESLMKWSLGTDTGLHLLAPEERGVFNVLVAAIGRAVQEHAGLLQVSKVLQPVVYVHAMAAVAVHAVECAFPLLVMNAIVADSLQLILDEIADVVKDRKVKGEALLKAALPVLRKTERGESQEGRGGIFSALLEKKTIQVFETILGEEELRCLYESWVKEYAQRIEKEATCMREFFETQILPVAQKQPFLEEAIEVCQGIQERQQQMADLGWEAKAKVACELLLPQMENLRKKVNTLGG